MSGNTVSRQTWPTASASAENTPDEHPPEEEDQDQPSPLGLQTYDEFVNKERESRSALPLPSQPTTTSESSQSPLVWNSLHASPFSQSTMPSMWPSTPQASRSLNMVIDTPSTSVSTTTAMWPRHRKSPGSFETPLTPASVWPPASLYQSGGVAVLPDSPLRVFKDTGFDSSESRSVIGAIPLQELKTPELPRRSRFFSNQTTDNESNRNSRLNRGHNTNKENVWPLTPWSSHRAGSSVLLPSFGNGRERGTRTAGSLSDVDPNRMMSARHQRDEKPMSLLPSVKTQDDYGSHRNVRSTADKAKEGDTLFMRLLAGPSPSDTEGHDSGCDLSDKRGQNVVVVDRETQTEDNGENGAESVSSTGPLSPLAQPPATGFELPTTGYEFELNHDGNLRELQRQKQWARVQLQSCNENNRFQHTQTTACIAAINGHMLDGYHPSSLRCYGTNSEVAGLRVTMTVYGDGTSSSKGCSVKGPALVLRHQIIVVHQPQHPYNHHQGSGPSRRSHSNNAQSSTLPVSLTPTPSAVAISPVVSVWSSPRSWQMANPGGIRAAGRAVTSSAGPTPLATPTGPATPLVRSLAPSPYSASPSAQSPLQGRRYLFATTTIPLRGGVAARPGYRPVAAIEAVERLRQWGGVPDQGVFGNAWLVHLTLEPGHLQHVVDHKVMDQIARAMAATASGTNKADTAPFDVTKTMRRVNERMQGLARHEGTLSILLSNHGTQKRIARQCPDLVAMWVLAQENL